MSDNDDVCSCGCGSKGIEHTTLEVWSTSPERARAFFGFPADIPVTDVRGPETEREKAEKHPTARLYSFDPKDVTKFTGRNPTD